MANEFVSPYESQGGGSLDFATAFSQTGSTRHAWVDADAVGPAGDTDADKLEENYTTNSSCWDNKNFTASTFPNSTTVYFSVFAKADERDFLQLWTTEGSTTGKYFDLSTGTVGANYTAAPTDSGIVPYGNGWYRCWIAIPSGTDGGLNITIGVAASDGFSSHTGVVGYGIHVWGAWADTVNYTDWGTRTYTFPTTGTGGAALDTDWFTTEIRSQGSSSLGLVSNKIRFQGETTSNGFGCRLQLLDGNGNGLWLENAKIECDIDFITDDDFRSYLWLTARQGAMDDWPADNYGNYGDPNDGVSARGWQFASVTSAQIWTREEAAGVDNDLYASTITAPVSGSTYHCEFTVDGNQVTSKRDLVGTGNQLDETDTTTITAGGYLAISFSGNEFDSTVDIYNIVVTNLDAPAGAVPILIQHYSE